MRIGVLTGGGDCPGLNAVIRAVVRTCDARYGSSVVGFQDGWRGLLENRRIQLQNDDRNDRLLAKGGTMLGTTRCQDLKTDHGCERALAVLKATLTMPGIAGVILTIGMAVDSNVLIFERIREELRAGKAIVSAVDAGFGKAWWTIVDTHVTTIVSCAFLFLFGTGPVRGFAVTLVIGLLANVFTAVFVSRVIFDYELSGKRQLKTLSI